MSPDDKVRTSTTDLPIGGKLQHALHDVGGGLLLTADSTISSGILEGFVKIGILEVLVHPDDADTLGISEPRVPPASASIRDAVEQVAEINQRLDALAQSTSLAVENTGPALCEKFVSHGAAPYDIRQHERIAKQFTKTTKLLDSMIQQVIEGVEQDAKTLAPVMSNFIAELMVDADNVLASSTEAAQDPQITERAVRMALLGMAVASEMGLDERHVRDVGLCSLVHDWGLFGMGIPEKLRDPSAALHSEDWDEWMRHPLYTMELLDRTQNISDTVRIASTQVHENEDGTGYPRGIKKEQIHLYAKILHVVDAYISLTSAMRGRPPYLPYDAMVYLLHQVKASKIDDDVMRAMLNTISLFPIGSRVRLSDGSEAQVIRRNAAKYTSPIVQRVGANRTFRPDATHASILDTSTSSVRLMMPLAAPNRKEVRIQQEMNEKIVWDGPRAK